LVLLKNCLGGPKLQYVLRTSPCCKHPQLVELDNLLRSTVTQICIVSLSDDQWTQASLLVRSDGLGVRSMSKLASSAFLASAASTQSLQNLILHKCQVEEEDTSASLLNWKSLSASDGLVHPRVSARERGTPQSQSKLFSHYWMRAPSNITEQDCWQQPQLTVETGSQQCQSPHADSA